VIDDLSIVKRFVRRIDDLKSAESCSGNGMMKKDPPGVAAHGGPLTGGSLEGLERGEALQNLSDAEPGNHQEGKEEDGAAGKQLLSYGAPLDHDQRQDRQLDA